MSKFESQYFDNADELVQAKSQAEENCRSRRERLLQVRRFSNMMSVMTPEEMEKLNRTENTNFGLAYTSLQQGEAPLAAIVRGTNSLLDLIVDTDNPEQDLRMSMRLNEAINRGVINHKGLFQNLWDRTIGEIMMSGGCPVVQNERVGWLPEARPNMIFPKGTPIEASRVPYAFDKCELSMDELQKMLHQIGDKEDGERLVKKSIKALIEALEAQIENNDKQQGSSTGFSSDASTEGTRESIINKSSTITAWKYYEVKWDDKGDSFVSYTLFTDGIEGVVSKNRGETKKVGSCVAQIVEYVEKAFTEPTDWLQMAYIDSEIGGVKNVDTCIGMAERIYPSSVEIEDLFNLTLEGDKDRSRPKYQDDGVNADDVEKWDRLTDAFVPKGLTPWDDKSSTAPLQAPIALLSQNIAGMTGGAVSNSGRNGELRQQAVDRQEKSSMLANNRLATAYNILESLLETIVWRVLTAKVKPGTEGYHDIMWVRSYLDKYDIPYKRLAKRKHGRFEFLRIRAQRSIGNGDFQQRIEAADWLMDNQMNYPPANRPLIVNRATMLRTQDPDFADRVAQVPQAIINSQKLVAENECDTIRRRSALGMEIPVGVDDVHQDHIPIHLLDMQGLIAEGGIKKGWSKLDEVQFTGLAVHTQAHLQILLSNPMTNPEAKPFLADFSNLISASIPLIEALEEEEGSEVGQLTPKEQADMELKWAIEQRKWFEMGVRVEDGQMLERNRLARQALSQRGQYAKEIDSNRRLSLDERRLEKEAAANNAANNGR